MTLLLIGGCCFVDYATNKLYWVDGRLNYIGVSNLDGSSRRDIVHGLMHPFSVLVYENFLYWTEWSPEAVKKIDKNSVPNNNTQLVTNAASQKPAGIQVGSQTRCVTLDPVQTVLPAR